MSGLAVLAGWASRAGAVVGAVALAAMILLITAQVVSRRLLSVPLVVADEVSGYLLVIVTFMGLGYALLNGDHIQVTLLTGSLGARTRAWLRVAWCVIAAPYLSLLLVRTAALAWESFHRQTFSVSATNFLLWPIQVFVPLGFAVLLLQLLAELALAARAVREAV
ncbi:MAG: TRAP transporter small permease [Candidatus Rokubacteria bacterium]|nr:TRAP transporter small permease [Candidatus Rokubacteria bacterium]